MYNNSLNILADRIKKRIAQEWRAQGHNLTGAFESSLSHEVVQGETTVLNIKGKHYGAFMQVGVRADQIRFPFARKRIEALTNYAMLRMGLDFRIAKRVAGAIAYRHSKEGMPLPGTRRFSSTGKRIGFVTDSIADIRQFAKDEFIKITKEKIYGDLIS